MNQVYLRDPGLKVYVIILTDPFCYVFHSFNAARKHVNYCEYKLVVPSVFKQIKKEKHGQKKKKRNLGSYYNELCVFYFTQNMYHHSSFFFNIDIY